VKQLTQSVGNNSFVTNYAYTALDQLQQETLPQLGGGFNTFYAYYGTGDTSANASPGAASNVAIKNDTQDVVKQSYSYNDNGGWCGIRRLAAMRPRIGRLIMTIRTS
jgi:hypothetical protein